MSKSRYWFVTQNFKEFDDSVGDTFTGFLAEVAKMGSVCYLAYAHGLGNECQTNHYHVNIEFDNPKDFGTVKNLFSSGGYFPDIEFQKGNHDQAMEYLQTNATETNTEVVEFGTSQQAGQGKRGDLDRLGEQLLNNEINIEYIARNHPGKFIQFGKRFRDLQSTATKKRTEPPDVEVLEFADTFVNIDFPIEAFVFDGKDWYGYMGQPEVYVDFAHTDPDLWLRLKSKYPLRVGPDHLYFTSPKIYKCMLSAHSHFGVHVGPPRKRG